MQSVNACLAAYGAIRQVRVVEFADSAANAAERAVRKTWMAVLRALKSGLPLVAGHLLRTLDQESRESIGHSLRRAAVWGHRSARRDIEQSLPTAFAVDAAAAKVWGPTEGTDNANQSTSNGGRSDVFHLADRSGGGHTVLTESLTVADLLAAFRDPNDATTHPPRGDLFDFLFPAFTPAQVDHVVYANDWEDRLRAATKLAEPSALARIISTGLALGKSHQEIALDLRPAVQGVVTSARRIARQECLRVAADVQDRCHDQLGDLVIGWQIHATIDERTRPWHAHRSGQIYYIHPKTGQKGLEQLPNPPDEARDPRERPPGTPFQAWG
jgi:hypothetical protein